MNRLKLDTMPPGGPRVTSVALVSTPVLQICPARVADRSTTSTAMPPPTSIPLGRLLLPKLSGLHPIAVVYGRDGVLEVVEPAHSALGPARR